MLLLTVWLFSRSSAKTSAFCVCSRKNCNLIQRAYPKVTTLVTSGFSSLLLSLLSEGHYFRVAKTWTCWTPHGPVLRDEKVYTVSNGYSETKGILFEKKNVIYIVYFKSGMCFPLNRNVKDLDHHYNH